MSVAAKNESTEQAKEQAADEARAELYRRLAHNDKVQRDRGVKMLRDFLQKRKRVSEVGMMKIWKAVFYCFWMSDKVPVQQELAERLATLIHALPESTALLYAQCFWKTIGREWNGIDRLRLDKFMSLVRHFLRHIFVTLHLKQWPTELVNAHVSAMAEVGINGSEGAYRGLVLHVADIFIDELVGAPKHAPQGSASERQIPSEAFRACLFPYYVLICNYHDQHIALRVGDRVFSYMMKKHADVDESDSSHVTIDLFAELSYAARLLFDLGAEPATRPKARKLFYELHQSIKSFLLSLQPDFQLPSAADFEAASSSSSDDAKADDENDDEMEDVDEDEDEDETEAEILAAMAEEEAKTTGKKRKQHSSAASAAKPATPAASTTTSGKGGKAAKKSASSASSASSSAAVTSSEPVVTVVEAPAAPVAVEDESSSSGKSKKAKKSEFTRRSIIEAREPVDALLAKQSPRPVIKTTSPTAAADSNAVDVDAGSAKTKKTTKKSQQTAVTKAAVSSSESSEQPQLTLHVTTESSAVKKGKKKASDYF